MWGGGTGKLTRKKKKKKIGKTTYEKKSFCMYMTDYIYLCYEIHPTDLINGDLFWGFTKSGISLYVCMYVRTLGTPTFRQKKWG